MKVYHARPISLYGTLQDLRDGLTLRKLGFTVVDPASDEYQERYKSEGMDVFIKLVSTCDALAFRAFPDGTIGAGIMKEIHAAQIHGMEIIELPSILSRRALSVEDTREYLRLMGYK